jgi:transposase
MHRKTQIINGVEYVYEDTCYWDAKKKRGDHKRNYIGKMVEGAFVPNKRYLLRLELEKTKQEAPKQGPAPVKECHREFYGATYLLDKIGETAGVTQDLKQCFPSLYKHLLSVIYFLILEDKPLYRFHKWSFTHCHPLKHDLPSQRSSELFSLITEADKMKFFKLQAERRLETEFLAVDSTSISSYSSLIKQAKYGKNKDGDKLPQINLLLLLGQNSGLPTYYKKLPGNIPDVKTVTNLLKDVDFLKLDKVKLVMDRGFYSADNVNAMYRQHYKFLVGGKLSLSFIKKKLEEIRFTLRTREYYHADGKIFAMGQLQEWPYEEKKPRSGEVVNDKRRIYVLYYYNAQKAVDDQNRFYEELDMYEAELKSGKLNPEHQKQYDKYFIYGATPVRGMRVEAKQEAVADAEKNFGYFALLSNGISDPMEALRTYRLKDLIEKAFGNLKERLNMRRESVTSEENLDGKLFVQFVALIYLCRIKKVMDEKHLFAKYTLAELLDELDVIELYQQPNHATHVGEITAKQKALFEAFGFEAPV